MVFGNANICCCCEIVALFLLYIPSLMPQGCDDEVWTLPWSDIHIAKVISFSYTLWTWFCDCCVTLKVFGFDCSCWLLDFKSVFFFLHPDWFATLKRTLALKLDVYNYVHLICLQLLSLMLWLLFFILKLFSSLPLLLLRAIETRLLIVVVNYRFLNR